MYSSIHSSARQTLQTGGVLLVALLLTGCVVFDAVQPSRNTQKAPPRRAAAETAAAGWTGNYVGLLPCPDCKALKVELGLYKDGTYKLLTQEMGAGRPAMERGGSFTFNANETRITLDSNGQNRSFDILANGRLRMLGKDGKVVTGADAGRFILRK